MVSAVHRAILICVMPELSSYNTYFLQNWLEMSPALKVEAAIETLVKHMVKATQSLTRGALSKWNYQNLPFFSRSWSCLCQLLSIGRAKMQYIELVYFSG